MPTTIQYPPEPIDSFSTYLQDGGKVVQNYDQALEDYLTIPVELPPKTYHYSREELEKLGAEDIQSICLARGRNVSDIIDKDTLIRIALNTQRVPVAFSSPSVPFSDPRLITGKTSQNEDDVSIHYPVVVITRQEIAPDGERNRSSALRKVSYAMGGDMLLMSPQPVPVILRYQIELISLYQQEINSMDASVIRGFGIRDSLMYVDLGVPWGRRVSFIVFDSGYSDETELEQPTAEIKRIFRHSYSVDVFGWIPEPVKMVRTVRDIVTSYEHYNFFTGKVEILAQTRQKAVIYDDEED